MDRHPSLFTSMQVSQIVGISWRQLQHWDRTSLIKPSFRTQGGHRRYSFEDIVALKTARRLLDGGVSVKKLRNIVGKLQRVLPKVKKPLEELTLVVTGDIILVFYEETAFEAVTGQHWILELADLQRDIKRWERRIVQLSKFRKGEKISVRGGGAIEAKGL